MAQTGGDRGSITVPLASSCWIVEPKLYPVCVFLDSCTASSDFVAATVRVTFQPSDDGQRVCAVFITLDDDIALEGDEAFNVDFEFVDPNSGAQKGTGSPGVVIIIDNDGE